MAYDVLAESLALIESRHVEPVRRLSRRRRFAAMAVDVADDMAVSMSARLGVGCIWQETHVLSFETGSGRALEVAVSPARRTCWPTGPRCCRTISGWAVMR